MNTKELLTRLLSLGHYGKRLRLPDDVLDEFLSYCSLQLMIGRNTNTAGWYFYVDFMRQRYGRKPRPMTRDLFFNLEDLESTYSEDDLIKRIDASKIISRIMQKLSLEEQLILKFLYFDDLTKKDVADIIGCTPSRITQKESEIFLKIKNFATIDGLGFSI